MLKAPQTVVFKMSRRPKLAWLVKGRNYSEALQRELIRGALCSVLFVATSSLNEMFQLLPFVKATKMNCFNYEALKYIHVVLSAFVRTRFSHSQIKRAVNKEITITRKSNGWIMMYTVR